MPGIICPVVAYAPSSATKPIIAQRPLTFSAFCGYPSYEALSSMYGRVSVGYIFCLPPDSVVVVIELLTYVTLLYIKV